MPVIARTEIDTYGYDVALKNIQVAPQTLERIVRLDVQPAVQEVVDRELKPYPPPIRPGAFKQLATPKQFRYVMAKIRRGEWTGRTGMLGQAWFTQVLPTMQGAILLAGNRSRIAKFVVGRYIQRFHVDTGWRTLQSREFTIVGAVLVALRKGWARELKG